MSGGAALQAGHHTHNHSASASSQSTPPPDTYLDIPHDDLAQPAKDADLAFDDDPAPDTLRTIKGMEVIFKDLTYTVALPSPSATTRLLARLRRRSHTPPGPTTKTVLRGVSGAAYPGELLAVMGPSGGGKTSLLNILASRGTAGATLGGDVRFDGRPRDKRTRRRVAYVTQDDLFFSNLTVGETLEITARLRLNAKKYPREAVARRVDEVTHRLRLTHTKNTIIGDQFRGRKGISGGERRRVNVANEMLVNPAVLILDEPTSGLDSTTAYTVVRLLRNLAREGRTIICSIHQPSSQVLAMFDKLLLVAEGSVVYYGKVDEAVPYFSSVGFPCPFGYNPADYFLQLLVGDHPGPLRGGDPRDEESDSEDADSTKNIKANLPHTSAVKTLIDAWASRNTPIESRFGPDAAEPVTSNSSKLGSLMRKVTLRETTSSRRGSRTDEEDGEKEPPKYPSSWLTQFLALSGRAFKQRRGDLFEITTIVQIIAVTLLVGIVWFQTAQVETSIDDIVGFMFFAAAFWGFVSMYGAVFSFPSEKPIVSKDRASGTYCLSAYFLAKSSAETLLELINPIIYSVIAYWMAGLNPNFGRFIVFVVLLELCAIAAQSMGLFVSAILMDLKKAQTLGTIIMLGSMVTSGFYVSNYNIPVWLRWLQYLSFIKYTYEGMIINNFEGETYACVPGQSTIYSKDGTVCPVTYDAIASTLDLRTYMGVGGNVGVLIAFAVGYRLLSYMALRFLHRGHKKVG